MNSYPIEVRKIAAEVPLFHYNHLNTWQSLYQHRETDEARIKLEMVRKAADQIVHKFVGHLIDRACIRTFEEPEGVAVRVTCVALSYDELVNLLYRAYAEGQSNGMRRTPQILVTDHKLEERVK